MRNLVDLGALPELFPHRVVRAAELVSLGISSATVHANTHPGGPWQRILPGVLLLSGRPPTRAQRIQAALRYAGPGAVLTGADALQLHGMRAASPGGPVHILVPHDRNLRFADGVAIERTIRLPNPLWCKNFPIAPVERAVLDAARRLRAPGDVRAIIAEVVRRGAAHPARLRDELDHGSTRGSALARQILTELSDGIRSVAEGWARRLIHDTHLPKPAWNVPLCDPAGDLLAVVDAWWDDAALAWTIDSSAWHSSVDRDSTLTTAAKLTAAGITVVSTPPARIQHDPVTVARELEDALAHARNRPRPTILAG
jgi:hypothetical protein